MQNLNWVDYIILAIFFFTVISGLSRGFVKEVISLASLVVAVIVASMFAKPLAATFTNSPAVQSVMSQASSSMGVNATEPVSMVTIGICFALIFAGTVILGSLISSVLNLIFQTGILGLTNRLLGAIFGFGKGYIMVIVLMFLIQLTPLAAQPWWQQSHFVSTSQSSVQWLGNLVAPGIANLKSKLGETMQNVNSTLQNATNSLTQ